MYTSISCGSGCNVMGELCAILTGWVLLGGDEMTAAYWSSSNSIITSSLHRAWL